MNKNLIMLVRDLLQAILPVILILFIFFALVTSELKNFF